MLLRSDPPLFSILKPEAEELQPLSPDCAPWQARRKRQTALLLDFPLLHPEQV